MPIAARCEVRSARAGVTDPLVLTNAMVRSPVFSSGPHGHFPDAWARQQRVLDLGGRDVDSVADDEILSSPGDREMPCRVEDPEITRREPTVGIEGVRVLPLVEIAGAAVRAAAVYLALDAMWRNGTVSQLDDDLDTGQQLAVR